MLDISRFLKIDAVITAKMLEVAQESLFLKRIIETNKYAMRALQTCQSTALTLLPTNLSTPRFPFRVC
jgi:hypothetical protein